MCDLVGRQLHSFPRAQARWRAACSAGQEVNEDNHAASHFLMPRVEGESKRGLHTRAASSRVPGAQELRGVFVASINKVDFSDKMLSASHFFYC